MMRSLFSIPGKNYSSRRGQNSVENVLSEQELFMRLGENAFVELRNDEIVKLPLYIDSVGKVHNFLKFAQFDHCT